MLTTIFFLLWETVCIAGLLIIAFAYLGFPLVLALLSKLAGKGGAAAETPKHDELPDIQVVISCYNEADIIEKRLADIFKQEYPGDKLSVLVISDGSTDETDKIVQKISQDEPRVALFATGVNLGKNEAINAAFRSGAFQQDLLCFTDADSEFEPFALSSAAGYFASPQTGLVGGQVHYWLGAASAHRAEGFFWQLENLIREAEGNLGWLVSCPGQFIMMRKELFQPLPPAANTDFALPLMVLAQGYASRFAPRAVVRSLFPAAQKSIFKRRWRTIIRALTTINIYKKQLPWKIRFILFWHKTARFYAFPVQGLVLLANLILLKTSLWWFVLFLAQMSFYGLAVLGWAFDRLNLKAPLVHLPYQFTLQNAVAFSAVVAYHHGQRVTKWTPPR